MKIEAGNSDEVVLGEIGRRLARTRLERNLSQEQLATESGVSKATIERLEKGAPVKSTSLIRVLRSLGRLDALDRLMPEPLPSPVERAKLRGKQRRRARARRDDRSDQGSGPWRWSEDGG